MLRKPTRILVVDASEVSRLIISRILATEMPSARVSTCGSAEEALRLIEVNKFDFISTSILLPDIDGLDLCRLIRKNPTHHFTPVIIVSGDADHRLLREGFAAGVTDYFDKSLGYQAFVDFIKSFVRRNAGMVGRVLYVEDSPSAAVLTIKIMERHGLQVVHTQSAEQALSLLEQSHGADPLDQTEFDIVITDFYLKGFMTGGDLLHAIRAKLHYSQQEMPVLVVTHEDNLDRQTEVFHAGANDFVTKPIVEEVLMARVRSLLLIKQQFNALRAQAEEMRRLATTDSLTGVHSKRYLLDHGEAFLSNPAHQPVAALLIDIDHFKRINDKLGHITGDHVLAGLGDLLNHSLPENCMAVRFGGEEFAILAANCPLPEASRLADGLRRAVEALNPMDIPVTISAGVASNEGLTRLNLTRLLLVADQALYSAKEQGRNRVCVASRPGQTPDNLLQFTPG